MNAVTTTCGLALLATVASGQEKSPSIELSGIPDELVLPVPKGQNRVLRATVRGATPRAVWLAKRRDAPARVLLTKTGAGRYEVNLADTVVWALLREAPGDERFRVFASTGKDVVGSVAVSYRVRPTAPELRLVSGKTRSGVGRFADRWIDIDATETLELRGVRSGRAVIGENSWSFAGKPERALTRPLDASLRKEWRRHGSLVVTAFDAKDQEFDWRLRAIPSRIDMKKGGPRVTVIQRSSEVMPETNGWLRIAIGDITWGRTLVKLTNGHGETLVAQKAMSEGNEVPLTFGKESYVLVLDDLVNLLIGDDYAVFVLTTPGDSERRKIEWLLKRVETVGELVFVRAGKDYGGEAAAAHLRGKYGRVRAKVTTVEQFIRDVASKSSTTGQPYKVRLAGKETPAETWLREQLRLRLTAPGKGSGGK